RVLRGARARAGGALRPGATGTRFVVASPRMGEQTGRLVARALAAEGVDTIFTLSGGHVMPIYEGCRLEGVRVVDVRHEQAAAHAPTSRPPSGPRSPRPAGRSTWSCRWTCCSPTAPHSRRRRPHRRGPSEIRAK